MMTAVIWCCVFNLAYAVNGILLVTFLFNVYEQLFHPSNFFYVFNVLKFFLNVLLHMRSHPSTRPSIYNKHLYSPE